MSISRLGLQPLALLCLFTSACAASTPARRPAKAPYRGDVAAPPALRVLPELSVADRETSEEMRYGLALAEESLGFRPPSPPESSRLTDISRWSRKELRQWLERKSVLLDSARKHLIRAAEKTPRHKVFVGAVIGLLYEDISRDLRTIPVPDEVKADEEIYSIFNAVVDSQAKPYLRYARMAYSSCVSEAESQRDLQDWASFCQGRARRLPDLGQRRAARSGT